MNDNIPEVTQINNQVAEGQVHPNLVQETDTSVANNDEKGFSSSTISSFNAELSVIEDSFKEDLGGTKVSGAVDVFKLPEVDISVKNNEKGAGYLLPKLATEEVEGDGDNRSSNNWIAILSLDKDKVLA